MDNPPNTRVLTADTPAVYLQPHGPAPCPVLMVGGIVVLIEDKKRAAMWAHILTNYALS